MYRFSVWKLVLVIVVFLGFLLYLIPTPDSLYYPLYGNLPLWMQEELPKFEITEDNALRMQLPESKGEYPEGINFNDATTELSEVLRGALNEIELEEGVDYEFDASTASHEFFVKFSSEKSKAELETTLANLHLYGRIPKVVRQLIPDNRLKLGLDLKGGVHLILEVDLEESKDGLLREHALSIPDSLRVDDILCREARPVSGKEALNVIVGIPSRYRSDANQGKEYLEKAEQILNELEFFEDAREVSSTDTQVTYEIHLSESGIKKYSQQAIEQVLIVLRNRVDAFGVAEPSIRREANRPRIIVELPGAKDSSQPLRIVKTMGRLEFKVVAKDPQGGKFWSNYALSRSPIPSDALQPDDIPEGTEIRYDYETGSWYVLESPVLLTGDRITSARPSPGQTQFDIVVSLNFDSQGRRKFAEVTGDNVERHLAILLDGKVQSAPVIRQQIIGNAIIEGNFTFEEASYLANILKAGAFPVGVKIAEERTVGPTLGQESIDNGIKAAIIGMGCVLISMIIYYKLSGLIAIIALVFNMAIILGALAGLGAALTLPGIAGLVLTIGMSVDANVLIFERIREELRTGKTVWSSIVTGYQRAKWTILDANFTTLAVALVLYQFGTGPIKGFAITLGIGILASIFTALVVTREMYGWLIGQRDVKKLSI